MCQGCKLILSHCGIEKKKTFRQTFQYMMCIKKSQPVFGNPSGRHINLEIEMIVKNYNETESREMHG